MTAQRRQDDTLREAVLAAAPPVNFGRNPDGTEDPQAAAYVEGWRDALAAMDSWLAAHPAPDAETGRLCLCHGVCECDYEAEQAALAPPSVPAGSEQPEPIAYCAHCGKGLHPGDPLCDHSGEPTPIRCMAPGCDGELTAFDDGVRREGVARSAAEGA